MAAAASKENGENQRKAMKSWRINNISVISAASTESEKINNVMAKAKWRRINGDQWRNNHQRKSKS